MTLTPEFLDGRLFRFFVTKNLVKYVRRASLHINGYALVDQREVAFKPDPINLQWPAEAGNGEGLEWFREDSMHPRIDFSYTPPQSTRIPLVVK
jgi:hypothetical protein